MRESSTYQAILEEGEERGVAKAAKRLLLRTGSIRFGSPDTTVVALLEAVTDPDELERLAGRVAEVETWQELLGP